jgi:hypothetical protein
VCQAHFDVFSPLTEYAPGTLPIVSFELRVFPCFLGFSGAASSSNL